MTDKLIPGTVMPFAGLEGGMFAVFRPMIRAADGLTLAQVSAITGLEYSTIQNWVKRGFVAHPVQKKYYEMHLARILIISMMRDSMKIDEIGELMRLVNGDVSDTSDDIISEERLYDYLCETVRRLDSLPSDDGLQEMIGEVTADYVPPTEGARRRLTLALLTMVNAYHAGMLKKKADMYFCEMKADDKG